MPRPKTHEMEACILNVTPKIKKKNPRTEPKPKLGAFGPSKNHNFRICLPKKIATFFSIPPENPLILFSQHKKIPLFFGTQKNPGVFHRPKKITSGQNFRPKKITRTPPPPPPSVIKTCEWGPWDVCMYE